MIKGITTNFNINSNPFIKLLRVIFTISSLSSCCCRSINRCKYCFKSSYLSSSCRNSKMNNSLNINSNPFIKLLRVIFTISSLSSCCSCCCCRSINRCKYCFKSSYLSSFCRNSKMNNSLNIFGTTTTKVTMRIES